jgi:hypothetical protein
MLLALKGCTFLTKMGSRFESLLLNINHDHLGRRPSEVLLGAIFVKSFSVKPWYEIGIFPRYYITYHDSMH